MENAQSINIEFSSRQIHRVCPKAHKIQIGFRLLLPIGCYYGTLSLQSNNHYFHIDDILYRSQTLFHLGQPMGRKNKWRKFPVPLGTAYKQLAIASPKS
jgi:hypothetical protein